MMTKIFRLVAPLIAVAACLASSVTQAFNGLNLIGFGAESNQMAGADVAVARDSSALNTNPAGLAGLRGNQGFDGFGDLVHALDVAHKDQFGNDKDVSNKYLGGINAGYAQRIGNSGFSAGLGFFVQGGAGNIYKDLNTAFGTRDEISTRFDIVKFTPGLGYRVNDRWMLGVSLAAVQSHIKQKFNAQNPNASFFGSQLGGASGTNSGLRLGAMFKATDTLTFGAAYGNKVPLRLRGGWLKANLTAVNPQLGVVTYNNAQVDGLAVPEELALGAAYRPLPPLLFSVKLSRLGWANAVKSATATATNPDNAFVPAQLQTLNFPITGDWKNQTVLALGLAYDLDEQTTLRGGYNYGENPVPNARLTPLFAATGEHHLTFGVVRRFREDWEVTGGIEYLLPAKNSYNSPLFGNAEERNTYIAFQVGIARWW
jgi:long-chain fatty acid transport protein